MVFLTTLIVLIILGIIDSGYLVYKHSKKQSLTCPIKTNCNAVLDSKWGKFLGVRNEVWGLLYYLSLLTMVWIGNFYIDIPYFNHLLLIYTFFGLSYSLFLTYVQIVKIKQYCLYCLLSASINLLLAINVLFI